MTDSPFSAGPTPPTAAEIFGDRIGLAERYARLLTGVGLERGMIGPREVPRLWDRHLLNCAVVTDLLPHGARVVDVGSGAGLPGLVLAIRRPDLRVDCVDSMRRRTDFLSEAVEDLELSSQVRVVHGRIEDASVTAEVGDSEWATARAVAPIARLVAWSLPALRPGGCLLAIKGASADVELADARSDLARLGADTGQVVSLGSDVLDAPTTVVVVRRKAALHGASRKGRT
jgi:16S rRNA (guanine527-N7)-methyltransferase